MVVTATNGYSNLNKLKLKSNSVMLKYSKATCLDVTILRSVDIKYFHYHRKLSDSTDVEPT